MQDILFDRYSITNKELLSKIKSGAGDCVFLAGSIVESMNMPYSQGMGNNLSDIDVFLISDSIDKWDAIYDEKDTKTDLIEINNDLRLDVELYKKSVIIGGLDKLKALQFEKGVWTYNLLKVSAHITMERFLSFVHRFLTGIVIAGADLDEYKDGSRMRENYFRLLARMAIGGIENNYDDVIGNLDMGNLEVGLFLARSILVQTAKLFLFSHRISLDRDKWVLLKLKNLAKNNEQARVFWDKVYGFYFSQVLDDKTLRNNIEGILEFSNNTITKYTKQHEV